MDNQDDREIQVDNIKDVPDGPGSAPRRPGQRTDYTNT